MNSTHNTQLTQKAAQKEGDFEGAGRLTPLHASTWKPHNIKHHITLIPLSSMGKWTVPLSTGIGREVEGGVNPIYNVFNFDWQIPSKEKKKNLPLSRGFGASSRV